MYSQYKGMFNNSKNYKHKVLWSLFAIYCISLFCVLFMRSRFDVGLSYLEQVKMSVNLVPFKSICGDLYVIIHGTNKHLIPHSIINILGNFALFMPYGFCIPLLSKRFRHFPMFLLLSLVLLLSVETLQVLSLRGSFDIDDIILNLIGAAIGFLIAGRARLRLSVD